MCSLCLQYSETLRFLFTHTNSSHNMKLSNHLTSPRFKSATIPNRSLLQEGGKCITFYVLHQQLHYN